jgi:pyrroloquinoline-quinone synthase
MEQKDFWREFEARVAPHDLLCHPFYQAWAQGKLTGEDLREYAAEYYHHVAAFPGYLGALASRLPEDELREAVRGNFSDEMGLDSPQARPHHVLWLEFAEGMGAASPAVCTREPIAEIQELIATFREVALTGSSAEALAMFYAYESQVPRVAKEKERGLRERYGAGDRTCAYFTLHRTADVAHSRVWREQLNRLLADEPERAAEALEAGAKAAQALWRALDGIERHRQARRGAASCVSKISGVRG